MPSCPHITIFKPGGWNPILEVQIKKYKGLCLYCIYKVNTQKVANILHIYKKCSTSATLCLQCKFAMYCKEFPPPFPP